MRANRLTFLALGLAVAWTASCRATPDLQTDADLIRDTERERLRALVEADMEVAERHTDSYERRDGRWQVVWSQATAMP